MVRVRRRGKGKKICNKSKDKGCRKGNKNKMVEKIGKRIGRESKE